MLSNITEYQDSYWNYDKPFEIDDDPYEAMVKDQIEIFQKPKPKRSKTPTKSRLIPKPPVKPNLTPKSNLSGSSKSPKTHRNGENFVSSDTKALKITPRIVVHPIIIPEHSCSSIVSPQIICDSSCEE